MHSLRPMLADLRRARPGFGHVLRLLVGAAYLACCGSAAAYWIGIVPASGTHPLGSPFTVDVVISGLESGGQVLSTYDFTIGFDETIIQLVGAESAGALGAGSLFLPAPDTGSVNLFELSFLSDAELAAAQGDLFTLATLSYQGVGLGTSVIDFGELLVLGGSLTGAGEATDLLLLSHTIGAAEATVVARTVPEPATLLLVALGLALVAPRVTRPGR